MLEILATVKTNVEDEKCVGKCGQQEPDHHTNVNFMTNVPAVVVTIQSMQDLVRVGN